MEVLLNTLTDEQRVETLNSVYKKGVTTPKDKLAFSADKLVYLKPFLSKLQAIDTADLGNRFMVRQVVDQLLQDIADDITVTSVRENVSVYKVAAEYGLSMLLPQYQEPMYLDKVA